MDICSLGGVLCCLRRYQVPRNARDGEPCKVQLDTSHMGNEVVIVKSGKRICGSGAAFANAPILQNKCYFEAKIQSGGMWGIGVATKKCDVNKVPLGNNPDSWVLRSDGTVAHNGKVCHRLSTIPEEGDMLACTYDHVEVNFYHNGKHLHCPLTGFKQTVYPIIYVLDVFCKFQPACRARIFSLISSLSGTFRPSQGVDDGTIVDVNFTDFAYQPPDGFMGIMFEKSLL